MKHLANGLTLHAAGMPKRFAVTAAAVALGVACLSARADVRYDFTAVSAYPVSGQSVSGAFSVIVPTFLSVSAQLPAASLLSCSATTNTGAAATCIDQWFTPGPFGRDAVGFGVSTALFANRHVNYYFALGAFSAYGMYSTVDFGADQFATLAVSQVASVPEPATWLSLFAGLGVVGAALRRKTVTAGLRRVHLQPVRTTIDKPRALFGPDADAGVDAMMTAAHGSCRSAGFVQAVNPRTAKPASRCNQLRGE